MGLFDFFKKKPEPKAAAVKKTAGPATQARVKPGPPSAGKKIKKKKEKQVGKVIHAFNKISVAIIRLKADLKVGDTIHIKGRYDDFTQPVKSMQIEHENIQSAKKGQEIGLKVVQRAHVNDKVFLAGE